MYRIMSLLIAIVFLVSCTSSELTREEYERLESKVDSLSWLYGVNKDVDIDQDKDIYEIYGKCEDAYYKLEYLKAQIDSLKSTKIKRRTVWLKGSEKAIEEK